MKKYVYYRDRKKTYLRKIKIYPPFLYKRLDKWLKVMSLQGWHIVHCNSLSFVFEKGEPACKEYFTYGLVTQEGKYSISLRYPMLEKTYGLNRKKSKINANRRKKYQVIEIDTDKIDVNNNIEYKELISERNTLYTRYFIRNLSAISIAFLVLCVLCFLF